MTEARLFDRVKPSDFVVALSADEGTKVDCPYRVVSVWRDENGGQGVTVELEDGCGAGLNQGEYEPLFRAPARPMTVAEAAKVLIAEINRPATQEDKPDWRYLSRLDLPSLRALSQGGE